MLILMLPPEIWQQILCQIVPLNNFADLRLVNSHFDDSIRGSAEYLMRSLVQSQGVSERIISLYTQRNACFTGRNVNEQKLSLLLRLHRDVTICARLESILNVHREKFTAFPIWADVPEKGFGSIEAMLLFAAFQNELLRSVSVPKQRATSTMISRASANNDEVDWMSLDQQFESFVRDQLTVNDLQALMTIVNFCAVSTRFIDTILTSRYYFNDAEATNHWQDEQLGSALLAERILWGGPLYLATALHQSTALDVPGQRATKLEIDTERITWRGPRGEAARLTANGVARFLWKERAKKLAIAHEALKTSPVEKSPGHAEVRLDAVVWRGSSGDL